jgi:hypothetical protein
MVRSDKPKRKADSATEGAAKRARTNSGASGTAKPPQNPTDATPKLLATIPFGVNPSPYAEKLCKSFNSMPLYLYVNLYAVSLFEQVDVDSTATTLTRLVF